MLKEEIEEAIKYLFSINRNLMGLEVRNTLKYVQNKILPDSKIKSISSGSKIYDWQVPCEWNIEEAYVKNKYGKKIIDIKNNNLHLMAYSEPVDKKVSKEELLEHLHTLPEHPKWIPYRTSFYKKNWAFCCEHELLNTKDFTGPFEVKIKSSFNDEGVLNWLECYKKGTLDDEILISSYCCHPNLANDNLSGFVAAAFLFRYLQSIKTKYSYRLVILPETIGAIAFLSQANVSNIVGGMILSCVAGPDKPSIKEGFNKEHWINRAAHQALNEITDGDYITYPFTPNGSDERQYSTPGFRIVTPSIHKSKYHEYLEYHTSADNLNFISIKDINYSIDIHKKWIENIESFCYPERLDKYCEFQLGRRNLYPSTGGSLNHFGHDIKKRLLKRSFDFNKNMNINNEHLEAFNWLMHLADGKNSNFDIAEKSNLSLTVINEAISIFYQNDLVKI